MIASMIFILVGLCFGPLGSQARNVENYGNELENVHERYTRQIAPGTKWCGNGDKAAHDEDFGSFAKTDACCREHDKCPTSMAAGETKYGLTNPDKSTRSHCDCDKKFYDCLTQISTPVISYSRFIRRLYFDFLRKKCFHRKECPDGEFCEEEYVWGDGKSYLPTEAQIDRQFHKTGMDPEMDYDYFEDYSTEYV